MNAKDAILMSKQMLPPTIAGIVAAVLILSHVHHFAAQIFGGVMIGYMLGFWHCHIATILHMDRFYKEIAEEMEEEVEE